jgi:hypothetical protein
VKEESNKNGARDPPTPSVSCSCLIISN